MKKKKFGVICAAAGICVASVLLLVGSMGIYAEKSETVEISPELTESEPSDALTKALTNTESTEKSVTAGPMSETELASVWKTLCEDFMASGLGEHDKNNRIMIEKLQKDQMAGADEVKNEALYTDTHLRDYPDSGLGASEIGLILLKEINRLYPEDALDQLKITNLQIDSDLGINDELFVEWTGFLDNGANIFDANNVSYHFAIDAISGKIMSFGRFYPYQQGVDYTAFSWTDEEVIARARELIETYGLSDGEDLDWSNLELYNGTEEAADLPRELREEPETSTQITNVIYFIKNNKRVFYFSMDWATGEISDYAWPGRSMPQDIPAQ